MNPKEIIEQKVEDFAKNEKAYHPKLTQKTETLFNEVICYNDLKI